MSACAPRRPSNQATCCALVIAFLFSTSARVDACTCLELSPSEAFARATHVFVGTVTGYEPPTVLTNSFGDHGRWTFETSRGWKGEPLEAVPVYSSIDPSSCGSQFEVGREYIVYASLRPEKAANWPEGTQFPVLLTGDCAGTRPIESASQDLSSLGEPVWHRGSAPAPFVLRQNRPNPFNPRTRIPFDLLKSATVTLRILDVSGRLVKTLASEILPAGRHEVVWDGREASGRESASGVYVFELRVQDRTSSRLMLLLR
jgi:hypothetical protein